jgi:ABC-type oligopeptide transport system ATPase subunit
VRKGNKKGDREAYDRHDVCLYTQTKRILMLRGKQVQKMKTTPQKALQIHPAVCMLIGAACIISEKKKHVRKNEIKERERKAKTQSTTTKKTKKQRSRKDIFFY